MFGKTLSWGTATGKGLKYASSHHKLVTLTDQYGRYYSNQIELKQFVDCVETLY